MSKPPKYALRFLRWFCREDYLEEIEGNLLELYETQSKDSQKVAKRKFFFDVLLHFRPDYIRSIKNPLPGTYRAMFKNYFISNWRNIRRQPFYTLLNLTGLTVSITAALFIFLYLHFELTFDKHHKRADQIYRIETTQIHTQDRVMDVEWRGTPGNLAPIIQEDYSEIQAIARIYPFGSGANTIFEFNGQEYPSEAVYYADSSLTEIFSFEFISSKGTEALGMPNQIALSASLASRIYRQENPLGKTLMVSQAGVSEPFILNVSGIYKDQPDNSHWLPQAIVSSQTDRTLSEAYFNRFGYSTYALLGTESNPEVLEAKLAEIYEKYLDQDREPVLKKAEHKLIPLLDIHFQDTDGQQYIYILGGVGALILLISLISYINMSTARSTKRGKEVGLRKVLGSGKRDVIIQFLSESMLFAMIAMGLALTLLFLSVDYINELLSIQVSIHQLLEPEILILLVGILFLSGIVGGSYPAFLLSSLKATHVIKGKLTERGNQQSVRRVLVAVQFAVVVFVLISTGMIQEQLEFIQHKDLGFEKEYVIAIDLPQEEARKMYQFQALLEKNPVIESFSYGDFLPGAGNIIRAPVSVETPDGPIQQFVRRGRIDVDFLSNMGISLIEGRNFVKGSQQDSSQAAIINQTFAREFGLNNPIGTKVRIGSQGNPNFYRVIGVIEDVHESSLYAPIQPQFIRLANRSMPHAFVKMKSNVQGGLGHLQVTWEQIYPNSPLNFRFIDELLQEEYEADLIRGRIFRAFSLLSTLIAFLGLFGLASYLTRQRLKEIGIRRVLGANTWNVLRLLTKNFVLMLFIASVPGILLAWIFIANWLENFAFQAEINYYLFVYVLFFTFLLTCVTTGIHAIYSARLNPAKVIRED